MITKINQTQFDKVPLSTAMQVVIEANDLSIQEFVNVIIKELLLKMIHN